MGLEPGNKIQLLQQNLMQPAKCCICHFGSDGLRKFIDFQLQIDRYGAVYICEFCCANVGQAVDMVPSQDFERVSVLLQETIEHKDQLAEELEDANNQLGVIRSFISVPGSDTLPVGTVVKVSEPFLGKSETVESEGNGPTESNSDPRDSVETSVPASTTQPKRIDL